MLSKSYTLQTGPFTVSLESSISLVKNYIQQHYSSCMTNTSDDHFIDYHLGVHHGPLYRRLLAPQAEFRLNHRVPFKPLPLSQAHAMFEWGLNWTITSSANQYFIIHAAVLEKNGQAIIISAAPGSGKSTLSAYLATQGWRLLSDELALIDPVTMQVYGTGRPINLKNQSIELMKNYYPEADFSPIAKDTHKGEVCLLKAPEASIANSHTPATPSLLLFVQYTPDEKCHIEKVPPAKSLIEIISNTFNFGLLNQLGFDIAKKLINNTQAYYLEYNSFSLARDAIDSVMKSPRGLQ